jgi:hypothetical protein
MTGAAMTPHVGATQLGQRLCLIRSSLRSDKSRTRSTLIERGATAAHGILRYKGFKSEADRYGLMLTVLGCGL